MKIHLCQQGSREWWDLHRGRATASRFASIITPKKRQLAAAADSYIAELIAELRGCQTPDRPTTAAMRAGLEREPEARRWYSFQRDAEVQQVGFIESDCGRFGASPDGLIGDDGLLEIKCPDPKTHVLWSIDHDENGNFPPDHEAQVHGELLVSGRAWVDFVSYCPPLKPLTIRVERGPFTVDLAAALELFWRRLEAWQKALGD